MEFLYFLESIRTPVGDFLMGLITHLGAETLFMVVALAVFWCVDKRWGYFLLFSGFAGTVCIQILKMVFRVPRPWVIDPNFSIVESARAEATGYSFPSGHTQCATALYGGIARSVSHKGLRIGALLVLLSVAFSRMYLGVHTPADVLVSLAIGTAVVFLLYPLVTRAYDKPRRMYAIIGTLLLLSLANLLFVTLFPFPSDTDPVNLENARNVAYQLFFIFLAMVIVYPVDVKRLRFDTRAVWWAQLLKCVLGLGIILLLRVLLKAPLQALLGAGMGNGVRYFIIGVTAGSLWPMTFGFWSRLGKRKRPTPEAERKGAQ